MFDGIQGRRFAAPRAEEHGAAGWNGRKSGRGFYDYSAAETEALKF